MVDRKKGWGDKCNLVSWPRYTQIGQCYTEFKKALLYYTTPTLLSSTHPWVGERKKIPQKKNDMEIEKLKIRFGKVKWLVI
jgi:hypothetical protein